MKGSLSVKSPTTDVQANLICLWSIVDGNFALDVRKIIVVCSCYRPWSAKSHDGRLEHIIASVGLI